MLLPSTDFVSGRQTPFCSNRASSAQPWANPFVPVRNRQLNCQLLMAVLRPSPRAKVHHAHRLRGENPSKTEPKLTKCAPHHRPCKKESCNDCCDGCSTSQHRLSQQQLEVFPSNIRVTNFLLTKKTCCLHLQVSATKMFAATCGSRTLL